MQISGNSTARAAFDIVADVGDVIGDVIVGALWSIANREPTLGNETGLTLSVSREHVLTNLRKQGWLSVVGAEMGVQMYKLSPRLADLTAEIDVIFSLHEEGAVWLHSVIFADGSPVTRERLIDFLSPNKRAR